MDYLEALMKWVVAPISVFVWMIYKTQQLHATEIAVMKATMASTKENHDREFKEVKENFKHVLEKLDDIEKALRK